MYSSKNYFYDLKKIHNILPLYFIDFKTNYYSAECTYDDKKFQVYLKQSETKQIDTDYLYFEIAILLTKKLNLQIDQYLNSI